MLLGSTKLFNVHGYGDCGDPCSEKIFFSVNDQIAKVGIGWVTVDVPDTTIEAGSFWISMEWQTTPLAYQRGSNSHFLAYDANADHAERSSLARNSNWVDLPEANRLGPLKDCTNCFAEGVGDLMITAVMEQ